MKTIAILTVALLGTLALAQDGRQAASYAFYNTWSDFTNGLNSGSTEFDHDCTAFASRAEHSGGWQYWGHTWQYASDYVWFDYNILGNWYRSYTWGGADNFENHLWKAGWATLVKRVTRQGTRYGPNLAIQPGDVIVADWGDGNESEPSSKNAADGTGDHVMVVIESLGNGDFLYCQHEDAKMRRFFDVFYSPNLSQAEFRFWHVNGNHSLNGYTENRMYRENNHPEVYLRTSAGFFWVHTYDDVNFFGGWGNVQVVPDNSLGFYGGQIPVAGTMVREHNHPEVWLADGLYKHWIRTQNAVARFGGWPAVRVVPDGSLSNVFIGNRSDIWQ